MTEQEKALSVSCPNCGAEAGKWCGLAWDNEWSPVVPHDLRCGDWFVHPDRMEMYYAQQASAPGDPPSVDEFDRVLERDGRI